MKLFLFILCISNAISYNIYSIYNNNDFIYKKNNKSNYINKKDILIFDKKMPILYSNIYVENIFLKKKIYSIEHVFPISFINSEKKTIISNDMHNLIKTTKYLNNARSNYKFTDFNDISNKNIWIHLDNKNFINHKKKLFIPCNNSKGFISRAIIYMYYKYNYNCDFKKIIDIDTLINWYYKYPPSLSEIYHNNMIKKIQYTDNIFISKYKKINLYNFLKKNDLY